MSDTMYAILSDYYEKMDLTPYGLATSCVEAEKGFDVIHNADFSKVAKWDLDDQDECFFGIIMETCDEDDIPRRMADAVVDFWMANAN